MNQVSRSGLLAVLFSFLTQTALLASGTVTVMDESHLRAALVGGGLVTFAADGTINLSGSLILVSSTTIDGTGHNVTLSGNNAVRVFMVNTPVTVTLANLTIANGRATGGNGAPGAAGGTGQGGAVLLNKGTLVASNCLFLANAALGGNGGTNVPTGTGGIGGTASGGAIEVIGGTVAATNCQFLGNSAGGGAGGGGNGLVLGSGGIGFGGAVHSSTGAVTFVDCLFVTNNVRGGMAGPFVSAGSPSSGGAFGGAICNQGGNVTNISCQFYGNLGFTPDTTATATNESIAGGLVQGGAIFIDSGSLAVVGGIFTSNGVVGANANFRNSPAGAGQGGAIANGAQMVLSGCRFDLNTAIGGNNGNSGGSGMGGAVFTAGSATISQSWFSSNSVNGGLAYTNVANTISGRGRGGAIDNSGSLVIDACTISDNQALGVSGLFLTVVAKIDPPTIGQAGGIFNAGSLLITNSTLTGNLAIGGATVTNSVDATGTNFSTGANAIGGGIWNSGGTVVLLNNTLVLNDAVGGAGPTNGTGIGGGIYNSSGTVTLINTLLSNGSSSSNAVGAMVDGGHNISSDASCNFTTGSLNNTDPMVGPLQDNGGPTPTMALLPGSPAIDAADTNTAPLLDQRGIVRPVGSGPDIGALENYTTQPACSYTLSTTNATFTSAASSGTVFVIANYYCDWTASSDSGWLTITSATNNAGTATLSYSLSANSGSSTPRVGMLTIAGQAVTVTQNGTDVTPPTVTITAPAANAKLTNAIVTIQGTAKDNIGLAAVEYRLENANGVGAYQTATGTSNWTADISAPTPGGNTVRVRARDLNNNLSSEVTRTFMSVQTSPLILTVNGPGTVSPNLNGQILQLGNTYTITAKPAAGNVFSNWTGSVTSTVAKLTFVMGSNMVLNATFSTNLFPNVQGTYNGLALDRTNLLHARSGYFSLKLTGLGTVSGQIIVGGIIHKVSSQTVSADGQVEIKLLGGRPKQQLMTATLQFDMTNGTGQVSGTLSDARVINGVSLPATWISEMSGDRAGFFTSTNPAPAAGAYTLLFPGGDGTNEPAGYGFATVKVDTLGNVQMTGLLADGTPILQKVAMSKDGRWPLFVKLALGGNASVLGWMNFTNQTGSDLSGDVVWTKLPLTLAVYYPAGFVESIAAVGSHYIPPTGTNGIVNFNSGFFQFSSGSVASPIVNTITLGADGKVTNTSPNALTAVINKTTGVFAGKVTVPGTSTILPFKGAVLQSQEVGFGYFLSLGKSGQVLLTH